MDGRLHFHNPPVIVIVIPHTSTSLSQILPYTYGIPIQVLQTSATRYSELIMLIEATCADLPIIASI